MAAAFTATYVLAFLPAGKGDPTWFDSPALTEKFGPAIFGTLVTTGLSTLFAITIGMLLGLLLVQTGRGGLIPDRDVYQAVSFVVNIVCSLSFIIGIIVLIPITKMIVGKPADLLATVVSLVILSAPFLTCPVETNLLTVDFSKIEAAQTMGISNRQIRWGIPVREAMPTLVQSVATSAIILIGHPAMVGAVDGGGLGQIAINYGHNHWQNNVMIFIVIAIIVTVQIIQLIGDLLSRLVDHRTR